MNASPKLAEKPGPWLLMLELLVVFVGLPALISFRPQLPLLPLLWVGAAWCATVLLRDPQFDRADLWRSAALASGGWRMLEQFALGAAALSVLVLLLAPHLLFSLVLQRPLLWLLIILLYPLLSVYPQELVYRTFFFHRYRRILPNPWALTVVNGLLFGYMHIVFHNWVAVGLSIAGGLLFAATFERSRSTLLVSLQHALFGCLLFTLGLGQFFYNGTVAGLSASLSW